LPRQRWMNWPVIAECSDCPRSVETHSGTTANSSRAGQWAFIFASWNQGNWWNRMNWWKRSNRWRRSNWWNRSKQRDEHTHDRCRRYYGADARDESEKLITACIRAYLCRCEPLQ
jgi:hypothetical protein